MINYTLFNTLKDRLNAALFGPVAVQAAQAATAETAPPFPLAQRLTGVGHMLIPEIPEPPAGFVWIEDGQLKDTRRLTDYEKTREGLLQPLFHQWAELYLQVAALKARFDDAFDQLETLNTRNTKRIGEGKKASMTLHALDRSFALSRKRADTVRFQEDQLLAAKALVDNCVARWAEGGRAEIKQIAELAFTKNAKGEYSRSGMVRLRRIDSEDPEWQEAMRMIQKAEIVDGVTSYLLASVRDKDGKYHPLPLDIAAVRPLVHAGGGE